MIEKAQKLLKKYYGYSSFRPGQEEIIENILQGKDTLAIMPTGAGKSICFQIPALLFEGITLVVSPLISLMKDQVDALTGNGISASFINSSLGYEEVQDRIYKAQNGLYKLLYIAPERLESDSFCQVLKSLDVSFVAVDEAHCVSQWGHDFRPSYRTVGKFINSFIKRPVIAGFTATATEEVRGDITNLIYLNEPKVFVTGFDRENLFFSVIRDENKKDFLLKYIEDNKDKSGIIYAATRKEVDNICSMLQQNGYPTGKYHAGMSDDERTAAQEAFLYDDIRIIVATNAFGMGIDKSNVRYVVHYNMPKAMESYYQEAGRAGRDGEPSDCILLFGAQDVLLQKFIIEQNSSSPERVAKEFKKLQDMTDYCHTSRCLRKYILEYFGETGIPDNCQNCSNCNSDMELTDVTIEAQKIFSCIIRMKERYGTSLVADVLKGSRNKKVLEFGFDSLSTYGILKEYSIKEIKDLINLFIAEDYLYLSGTEYPVVRLKEKAVPVLKGTEKVFQRIARRENKAESGNSLFELLLAKRHLIAEMEKIPPYLIFSDSTLREMSICLPADKESLLSLKGVGEVRLEKYGAEFLSIVSKYCKEKGIEARNISLPENESRTGNEEPPSHIVSLNMYRDGVSIKDIAKDRNLKEITIQDHLIRCFTEGEDVDLTPFIPNKYESLILSKIKEIGGEKLKPLKDALPDEVDYMAIKAVLCKYTKS